jgi:hypothetical protein
VLKYTAGHINYGGRVTDDWDRRCIMNILEDFYNPIVVNDAYNFDDSKVYHQLPEGSEHPAYLAYIKSFEGSCGYVSTTRRNVEQLVQQPSASFIWAKAVNTLALNIIYLLLKRLIFLLLMVRSLIRA